MPPSPPSKRGRMKLQKTIETCLYVTDLEVACRFYERLLGIRPYSHLENRHVFFRLESTMFLLFNPEETRRPDGELPPHGARGPGHVAFQVPVNDLPAWRRRLTELAIPIESDWTWPSGAQSLYFRDPDDNSIEITVGATWMLPDA